MALSGCSVEAMRGRTTEKVPTLIGPGMGDLLRLQWLAPTPETFYLYTLDPAVQPQRPPWCPLCQTSREAVNGLMADARRIDDEIQARLSRTSPPSAEIHADKALFHHSSVSG
jgi:hypothetical protein